MISLFQFSLLERPCSIKVDASDPSICHSFIDDFPQLTCSFEVLRDSIMHSFKYKEETRNFCLISRIFFLSRSESTSNGSFDNRVDWRKVRLLETFKLDNLQDLRLPASFRYFRTSIRLQFRHEHSKAMEIAQIMRNSR